MSSNTSAATLEDLAQVEGRAELVGGCIVQIPFSTIRKGRIEGRLLVSLNDYGDETGNGEAFTGGVAYVVNIPGSNRRTFSSDISFHSGPFPANPMAFIEGAPTFAIEIREENEYDEASARARRIRFGEYFAAGTRLIWDIDPENATVISHRPDSGQPVVFTDGEIANAEPYLPGWKIEVRGLFSDR
jgi:Uma2 family endonuclease